MARFSGYDVRGSDIDPDELRHFGLEGIYITDTAGLEWQITVDEEGHLITSPNYEFIYQLEVSATDDFVDGQGNEIVYLSGGAINESGKLINELSAIGATVGANDELMIQQDGSTQVKKVGWDTLLTYLQA